MKDMEMIVAMDENNLIGSNNDLPWGRSLPADLKHFIEKTLYKSVVMGRKTYESIPKKFRPLHNRENIVMTRQDIQFEGCKVVNSVWDVINFGKKDKKIIIAGGSEIYKQFLPMVTTIYITKVHKTFEGDSYFPKFSLDNWEIISSETHKADEKNKYSYTFETIRKKL